MTTLQVKGLLDLKKHLENALELKYIKETVKQNGQELKENMVRNAVFTRGHSTGQTRRSIKLTRANSGFSVKVKPTTDYAPYLEYGTRFMSAQRFVKPSFDKQSKIFLEDIKKVMR